MVRVPLLTNRKFFCFHARAAGLEYTIYLPNVNIRSTNANSHQWLCRCCTVTVTFKGQTTPTHYYIFSTPSNRFGALFQLVDNLFRRQRERDLRGRYGTHNMVCTLVCKMSTLHVNDFTSCMRNYGIVEVLPWWYAVYLGQFDPFK